MRRNRRVESLFQELTDKWDQLRAMLNRKAYAEAKELEELAASGF
jgi:hypothetical protein